MTGKHSRRTALRTLSAGATVAVATPLLSAAAAAPPDPFDETFGRIRAGMAHLTPLDHALLLEFLQKSTDISLRHFFKDPAGA